MNGFGCLLALVMVAFGVQGALAVEKKSKDPFDGSVTGNNGFPAPTPAQTPSLNENENTESGRSFTIGGSDGWNIKEYEDIEDAIVGDEIVFHWVGSHSVWSMKEKKCSFKAGFANELAASDHSLGFAPPTFETFRMTMTEPGTFHFADGVSNNCQHGMLFSVTVSPA